MSWFLASLFLLLSAARQNESGIRLTAYRDYSRVVFSRFSASEKIEILIAERRFYFYW